MITRNNAALLTTSSLLSAIVIGTFTIGVADYPRAIRRAFLPLSSPSEVWDTDFSKILKKNNFSTTATREEQSKLDIVMAIQLVILLFWIITINGAVANRDYGFLRIALIILGLLMAGMGVMPG